MDLSSAAEAQCHSRHWPPWACSLPFNCTSVSHSPASAALAQFEQPLSSSSLKPLNLHPNLEDQWRGTWRMEDAVVTFV